MAASYRKIPVLECHFNSEFCEIFKGTYFEEHLRSAASENVFMRLRKMFSYFQKFIQRSFNFTFKKQVISTSVSETSLWSVSYDWFLMKFVFTYNISLVWWEWTPITKYLELIKRISQFQEKSMSCESALNFD